jgi:hypothetical protein
VYVPSGAAHQRQQFSRSRTVQAIRHTYALIFLGVDQKAAPHLYFPLTSSNLSSRDVTKTPSLTISGLKLILTGKLALVLDPSQIFFVSMNDLLVTVPMP